MLETNKIILGDCIEEMKKLSDNSVDAIITDPPYGLGFMGKEWDTMDSSQFGIAGNEGENDLKVKKNFKILPRIAEGGALQKFSYDWAKECLRVLKPGAYLLSFGGCYDEQTEILTRDGWKFFKDVTKKDEVITLNPQTEEMEYQYPLEIVSFNNYKKLYHFKTNKIDLVVTPNHKMFVKCMGGYRNSKWNLIRADKVKNAIRMKKNGIWKGIKQDFFILPKNKQSNGHYIYGIKEKKIPMDTWLKFLGLWIAEGSSTITKINKGKGYNVQICHFNNKNLDELERELSPYFKICRYKDSGKFRINNKQLAEYLLPYCYSWKKYVPFEIKQLCPEQLNILLDWYMRGDSDGRRCYTCSKKLVDDLQEISLKIGISADYVICKNKKGKINGRTINQKHTQYSVSINRKQNEPEVYQKKGKIINIKSLVNYNSLVYCVEVPKYHTLYVRRNGKTAWCGNTRTYHRMACGIEDAGFEIRDCIMWLYGSGFPKSLNIGKQIDKINGKRQEDFIALGDYIKEQRLKLNFPQIEISKNFPSRTGGITGCVSNWELGMNVPTKEQWIILKEKLQLDNKFDYIIEREEAEREIIGKQDYTAPTELYQIGENKEGIRTDINITLPNLPEAKEWEGWGTALKPACEPIVVARKPLSEKNVALNVLKHGTGGINIDECRIGFLNKADEDESKNKNQHSKYPNSIMRNPAPHGIYHPDKRPPEDYTAQGRFPANIILDEEAGKMLDEQSGILGSNSLAIRKTFNTGGTGNVYTTTNDNVGNVVSIKGMGGASRFFYCAKSSKAERNFGLDDKQPIRYEDKPIPINEPHNSKDLEERYSMTSKNNHPTVKPIALMEYLIKLVSRENAIVLDPFGGSGTTMIACLKLNRKCILIEKEEEYVKIANARIKPFLEQQRLKC